MAKCEGFRTFKERGEWVEAQFIAEALRRGYTVLKPWGDSRAFDVALSFGSRIVRVQVKSSTHRVGTGYRCHLERNRRSSPYTLKQVDFFAAWIVPENLWYLIPARALVNGDHLKKGPMLCPCSRWRKTGICTRSFGKRGVCWGRGRREWSAGYEGLALSTRVFRGLAHP